MKKLFLARISQVLILLFAIGILSFLLWEPQAEGVNAHKNLSEIYLMDPFVIVVYSVALVFFAALYQIFQAIGYSTQNDTEKMVLSLRKARYLILPVIFSVLCGEVAIFLHESDDQAGGVFISNAALILLIVIFMGTRAIEKKAIGNFTKRIL